jgi:hypothetical protein
MRNVSNKVVEKIKRTFYAQKCFPLKIASFIGKCRKMWYNQAGQR